MRVTIYDKKPGVGFLQWCLKVSWAFGCWYQKLVGAVDDYYGAESWADAKAWLVKKGAPLTVIQYWGHGSPGSVWLAQKLVPAGEWLSLKPYITPDTLLWFRVCESFQGTQGQHFSKLLADGLGCTIGGHTRIIGIWQGGLYTRKPNTDPSWPVDEATKVPSWMRDDLVFWNKHTILCLRTKIPNGW